MTTLFPPGQVEHDMGRREDYPRSPGGYGTSVLEPQEQQHERQEQQRDFPVWLRAVVMLGVPAASALYLTWWATTGVSASVTAIKEQQAQHVEAEAHFRADAREELKALHHYLRMICVNTAKTAEDRRGCWSGK